MNQKPDIPAIETDARFPSGAWVGFWMQGGFGKQRMLLSLEFRDGRVDGEDGDMVGPFTFKGRYDLKTGRCLLTKQYLHAHSVQYEGVSEGADLWLWGLWNVGGDKGGFHLWPEGEQDPTQKRTAEEIELPREKKLRVPADLLPF